MLKIIRAFVFKFGHSRSTLGKREISRFCEQLRILLASGIPLLEALKIVSKIFRRKEMEDLIKRLSNGQSLANSMQKYFPPLVISSIAGAERSGNLEEVLGRLSSFFEQRAEMEEKIKSSLIYPCFVMLLCLFSLIALFVLVIPGFKDLFAELGARLPFYTWLILASSEFILKHWYKALLAFFTFLILFRYYRKNRASLMFDKIVLRINFLGREQIIQGFRTLGALLQGGVPIIEALQITIESSTNRAFRKIVTEIREAIASGERLSNALSKYRLFPSEAAQMISVGEGSGKLSEMLLSIAGFYEKERELFIKRFTALLEPALTLIVGIVVGIIALSMFLPMMDMVSKLQ
jgi:type II secretory pathway component PulF